ncbi:MAG: hypothetical protein NTV44_00975 [Firmicutes bacterium]|nr:hypothetical protein [Bacillota bacterium]
MELTSKKIRKIALSQYKTYWAQLLAMSFSFIIVFIGALVLNVVFNFSIIFTVPIIVAPLFFCLQIGSVRLKAEGHLNTKEYYHFYPMGLSGKFRGAYRLLATTLKTLFIFLIAVFAFGIIATYVFPLFDSAFAATMADFTTLATNSNVTYEALLAFMNEHYDAFAPMINTIGVSAVAVAFFYFLDATGTNLLIVNLSLNMLSDRRLLVYVHKRAYPEIRHEYRKLYFGAMWPAILLYIAGFALGTLIGWLAFDNYIVIASFGMIGALLFLWPMLPVFLSVSEQLYEKFSPVYFRYSSEEIKKTIDAINKNDALTPEEREDIKTFFDAQSELEKKIKEDIEEMKKPANPDEKKDDDDPDKEADKK